MRRTACLFCLAALLATVGCGEKQHYQYDWCNYSDTYYAIAKQNCEATQAQHMVELRRIIEMAEKKKLNVPPGIFAEYGFLLFKSGKAHDSLSWYAKEKKLYPESTMFVEMLSRVAQSQIDKGKAPQGGVELPVTPPESNDAQQPAAPLPAYPVETAPAQAETKG